MAIVDKFLKSAQGPIFDPVDNCDNEKIDKRDRQRKGRRGLENYDYLGYCWNGRESKTITDFLSSSPSYNIPVPPQIRLNNTQQIWFSRAPTHRRQDHKYNTEIQKYRTIQSRKYDIPVAWGRRGDNHKHIRAFPLTVSAWLASLVGYLHQGGNSDVFW